MFIGDKILMKHWAAIFRNYINSEIGKIIDTVSEERLDNYLFLSDKVAHYLSETEESVRE